MIIRKVARASFVILSMFFISVPTAQATPVSVLFGGSIDRLACCFTDYGLGIAVGDRFIGNILYDSNALPTFSSPSFMSYAANSFNVRIQDVLLTGINPVMGFNSDNHLTYFYVNAQLAHGLSMSFGLTRGTPGPSAVLTNLSPPTYLSHTDWVLNCFTIGPSASAIETGCSSLSSITASGGQISTPDDFFVRTLPEPASIVLLGFGLLLTVIYGDPCAKRGQIELSRVSRTVN